jgi:hypothetical protein
MGPSTSERSKRDAVGGREVMADNATLDNARP